MKLSSANSPCEKPSAVFSQKDSHLRKKRHDTLKELGVKPTTCIIGVKCVDGLVLAGDRKVLRGAEYAFEDKIKQIFPNFLVSSSGLSGLMDKFQIEIASYLRSEEAKGKDWWAFLNTLENITNSLFNRYFQRFENDPDSQVYSFDVLLGCKPIRDQTQLYRLYRNGFAQEVKSFDIIGHGSAYVLPFIKTLYNEKRTMREMAKVSAFSLKLVDEARIDLTVGGEPQIFLVPNIGDATEMNKAEVDQLLNNVSPSDVLAGLFKLLY